MCRSCERWNLSPLEERWEAIEEAEKLYRDTRRRVSTDNIGLAKLASGRRSCASASRSVPSSPRGGTAISSAAAAIARSSAGGGIAAVAALTAGGAAAGVAVGSFGFLYVQVGAASFYGGGETVVARVRTERHGVVDVRRRHLAEPSIDTTDAGRLRLFLRFKHGSEEFTGPEAERIAAIVLPKVNRFGGKKSEVADAVQRIESVGNSERFLREASRQAQGAIKSMTDGVSPRKAKSRQMEFNKYGLFSPPPRNGWRWRWRCTRRPSGAHWRANSRSSNAPRPTRKRSRRSPTTSSSPSRSRRSSSG
ncbi:MAG: hypothetical protein IPP20_20755 [Gemmatimonadetes bacterium]|nr:hypothetical protein [Gemmatimonadota bacterium]